MTVLPSSGGPHCPRCNAPLALSAIHTGVMTCELCRRDFEATAFQPPERQRPAVAEVVAAGPEGANACANHERNAAVTSCQRCGLFICSLCEMTVGEGTFCPSCFDRLRAEGTLASARTRYRDYGTMAKIWAISAPLISLGCLGLTLMPFGILAVYYSRKGAAQRRLEGRSTAGMIAVAVFGVIEAVGGLALIIFWIWSFTRPGALK